MVFRKNNGVKFDSVILVVYQTTHIYSMDLNHVKNTDLMIRSVSIHFCVCTTESFIPPYIYIGLCILTVMSCNCSIISIGQNLNNNIYVIWILKHCQYHSNQSEIFLILPWDFLYSTAEKIVFRYALDLKKIFSSRCLTSHLHHVLTCVFVLVWVYAHAYRCHSNGIHRNTLC